MKAWLLTLLSLALVQLASGQAFLGLYGTDNSISQIRENPAFAVHDDRMQLNFGSIGISVGGNSLLFKKSVFNFFSSGEVRAGKDYHKNDNSQPDRMFWGNVEVQGPGAAVLVKRRYFFAVTTGVRDLVNADNLNSRTFSVFGADAPRNPNILDSYTVHNFSMTEQVFSELNLTYAGYFYENEDYNLMGGITVKVLNGLGAAAVGVPSASFKTYNNDGELHNLTGTANIAFTPYANKFAISNNPFSAFNSAANNLGLGIDMGAVYYINLNDAMVKQKGYVARFAASITDIGSISYSASSTSGKYTTFNKTVNYRDAQNNDEITFGNRIFNNYLVDTIAVPMSKLKKFKVSLPTALHLNADAKITGRLWLNANVLIDLRQPSADKYMNHYISTATLTPRYNFGRFSLCAPLSYNAVKQGYMGLLFASGPFYIGSNSLFQFFASNTMNNVNLFAGATWRVMPRRQKEKEMMMM